MIPMADRMCITLYFKYVICEIRFRKCLENYVDVSNVLYQKLFNEDYLNQYNLPKYGTSNEYGCQ